MFYGANQTGCEGLPGNVGPVLALEHAGRPQERVRSIKAFSETDFTEDLKKFDIPTLVMHGEDDQIVPVKDSAKKSATLIKGAAEIYYPGLRTASPPRMRTSSTATYSRSVSKANERLRKDGRVQEKALEFAVGRRSSTAVVGAQRPTPNRVSTVPVTRKPQET